MNRKQQFRKKINIGDKAFSVVNVIFYALFALICLYPFYYVLINSISDNTKVLIGAIKFIPEGIHFKNYINIFKLSGFPRATINSILRTVLGTGTTLLSCTALGYMMTRPEYWHRKFWYRFLIITMYFGAGLIPGYLNIKRLGLLNNFWVYVIPAAVSPYNMILVKTYIESIPQSLEEAAIMDGAGYLKRFTNIIIPLAKPIIATIAIFAAVGQWNSFMDTVIYMTGNDNQTLQSLLYQYLSRSDLLASAMKNGTGYLLTDEQIKTIATPLSARYTITAVTLLPVLMIYPFFQRYFTKGIMIGAVKG